MAERPADLEGLCCRLGIQHSDLLLNCIFCNRHLSVGDLLSFMWKELQIVWRKDWPYGACSPCIKLQAEVQCWREFHSSVFGETLEKEEGQPLANITVRCTVCWKKLGGYEKIVLVDNGQRFHYIGTGIRGLCLFCLRERQARRRPPPPPSSSSDTDSDEGPETWV